MQTRASHQSIPSGLPIEARWCQAQGLAGGRAWARHLAGVLVVDRGYCGGRSWLERCAERAGTPSISSLAGTKSLRGVGVASIPSGTDDDGFSDCHECARSHIAGVYPLGPRYVTSTNCAGLLARWVTWAAVVMERVSGVVLPVVYILCCRCGVPRDGGVPRGGVLFRASRVFVVVPRVTWLLCALRHVGPRRASK